MRQLLWLMLLVAIPACNQILGIPEPQHVTDAGTNESPPPADVAPRAEQVKIEGHGDSAQVRQGAGRITLLVSGKGLAALSEARLGSWPATPEPGATAKQVRLVVDIPHGASLGGVELFLASPIGHSSAPAVVQVTAITATPGGDDATGRGTQDLPLRSLSRALVLAAEGDTVFLENGTYSVASGERWRELPSALAPPAPDANVPAGVTIIGESRTDTILEGDDAPDALEAGLVFAGPGTLRKLRLRNFNQAVIVGAGTVEIDEVAFLNSDSHGLVVFGSASVTVTGSVFADHGSEGIRATGHSTLTVRSSAVSGCKSTGIYIEDATVTLDHVEALQNGSLASGPRSGVYVTGKSTVDVQECSVHDNELSGMVIRGIAGGHVTVRNSSMIKNGNPGYLNSPSSFGLDASGYDELTVEGGQFANNGGGGIQVFKSATSIIHGAALVDNFTVGLVVSGAKSVTVRGTQIHGNGNCCGIYMNRSGNQKLDFGTSRDPGLNDISDGRHAIDDSRAASDAVGTFVGSTINHRTLTGEVTGPAEGPGDYQISNQSTLQFDPPPADPTPPHAAE